MYKIFQKEFELQLKYLADVLGLGCMTPDKRLKKIDKNKNKIRLIVCELCRVSSLTFCRDNAYSWGEGGGGEGGIVFYKQTFLILRRF